MNRLFLCANGEKLVRAVETLGETLGLEPVVLHVPRIDSLYEIDAEDREAQSVPAVAAVLPLMIDVNAVDVPDLLREVRRAPDLSWQSRLLRCGWPAVAAILFLCMAFGLVTHERRRSEQVANERGAMEAAFEATKARYSKLAQARGLVGHLLEIKKHTRELDWDQLLVRVTQSLPDVAKLNEYRIESGGRIRLEGAIQDESAVYDLVENLRLVPGVTQVALRGTSPDPQSDGTRFVIHLLTEPTTPPATGA